MDKINRHREFPRTPLAAACALALATACGGGGSGGGSDNGDDDTQQSTLSAEEQAALAAVTGTETVDSARDQADDAGYGDDDDPNTSSTADGVVAMSGGEDSEVLSCADFNGEGSIHVWDSEDSERPEPDITPDVTSPSDLAGVLKDADDDTFEGELSSGDIIEIQQRANCTFSQLGEDQTFKGGLDSIRLEVSDETVVAYSAIGRPEYDDFDPADQPILKNDRPFEFGSTSSGSEAFGVIYNCLGCPAGNLSDLTGKEQDSAFAGFLRVELDVDDGSGGTRELEYSVGNVGAVQSFSLTTEYDDGEEETTVLMNGPLAFSDSAASECSLDAEYVMDPNNGQGIVVEDFAGDGDDIKAGSSMTVIIDDVDYEVVFEEDGILVNGEPVDIDAEADTCGPPEQNA